MCTGADDAGRVPPAGNLTSRSLPAMPSTIKPPALGTLCTFDFGDPSGAYNVLTGFNAAHIYQTPGDYTLKVTHPGTADVLKTIHVLPDKRGVQTVAARDSISDIVRGMEKDTVVLLPRARPGMLPGRWSSMAATSSFAPPARAPPRASGESRASAPPPSFSTAWTSPSAASSSTAIAT